MARAQTRRCRLLSGDVQGRTETAIFYSRRALGGGLYFITCSAALGLGLLSFVGDGQPLDTSAGEGRVERCDADSFPRITYRGGLHFGVTTVANV